MPVDTSMYNMIQGPEQQMQSLSQMAGIRNAMQQNKILQAEAAQKGIQTQEMQGLRPILQNTEAYTDERGNLDFNKLMPMVMKIAPTTGMAVVEKMAIAQQQRTAAQQAISTQTSDALKRASNAIFSLGQDATPESIEQTRDALNSNFDNPDAKMATNQVFNRLIKTFGDTKPGDPQRGKSLKDAALMYSPIETQQSIGTPTPITLQNAQGSVQQNIKPGVPGMPQYAGLPGSYTEQGLAPSTPVVGEGNTPGYLGSQGNANPSNSLLSSAQGGKGGKGFVASGLPAGAQENIRSNVEEMNRHFSSLQDQSSGMPLVQSLRGNIRALADKAITGTEKDRLSYLNGLLAALPGHGHADNVKEATDLLEKNMSQLNLSTPASTDAARSLVTLSRPHGTMSAEAIKEATDQVASQVEANMAVRNHLSGYKYASGGQGNPQAYQQERQAIEKVADPRVWQYMSLQPGSNEAKQFMKKLTTKDKQDLVQKARTLQQMGIIQ